MLKMVTRQIHIGTRTSQLARWQTNFVASALTSHWPTLQISTVPVITSGDRTLDRALPEIGGKGLFTAELEQRLHDGEIDLAVHSLKDLPVENSPGLVIGAVLARQHVADVLISSGGHTLSTLPNHAIVGTSSLRRQAQLMAYRNDLRVQNIRGNVDTRIKKVMDGNYDAAVLALAGVTRLGLDEYISETLSFDVMLPAPGQGALAVQCRASDAEIRHFLQAIDDEAARTATLAERLFLFELGGGCSAPIGALAVVDESLDGTAHALTMRVRVLAPDGHEVMEAEGSAADAYTLAAQLAAEIEKRGGKKLLPASVHAQADASALTGKHIVITRAEAQAADMADELRRRGATPIVLSAIELAPVQDHARIKRFLQQLDTYAWLVFTSASAVQFFTNVWQATMGSLDLMAGIKIAAVGPATAKALEATGLWVDAMPATYIGAEIANTLGDIRDQRILLPRSALGRPELVDALVGAGGQVEDLPLYKPVPSTISREQLLGALENRVDAFTFTSPSTVRTFVAAVRAARLPAPVFDGALIACIGPTTAQAIEEEGLQVDVIAQEHTIAGLIAALDTAFSQRNSRP